ncbi:hemolymph lipopolysaccharide-binding protein [Anabrus simplex]|uniref:hemolymph lipopolysaccharide-binding protein n=1 Tax=Anabrus simplex TaxID=316456 RepID=UPI0035A3D2D1
MERQIMVAVLLFIFSTTMLIESVSSMSLSITSHWNQTGHEITQFQVAHSSEAAAEGEVVPWQLNITRGDAESSGKNSSYLYLSGALTVKAKAAPASDYEFFPLVGRYKLHTTGKTWVEAYNICEHERAHLAIINSETEAKVLQGIFQRAPKPKEVQFSNIAFLGFTDIVTEGNYVTIFGENIVDAGFAKWNTNEPNNYGANATHPGQDCGALEKASGLLDDGTCFHKFAFFCEQEL